MLKRFAWALLPMTLVIQVVPAPYRIEPAPVSLQQSVSADPSVPNAVKGILRRACMNCHSEQTQVPWYGRVAPVSWLMARDVGKGRGAMNLSQWGNKAASMRAALAAVACEDVRRGRMPPAAYLMMHPEARLSPRDVDALCKWSEELMAVARLRSRR